MAGTKINVEIVMHRSGFVDLMSSSHLSLVNQKLVYAAFTMKSLDLLGTDRIHTRALLDATLFHLVCAYKFYLRELADMYRVAEVSTINDLADLIHTLPKRSALPAEVAELNELAASSESWLGLLLAYWDRLMQSPQKPKEIKSFSAQPNQIHVVDLTEVPLDSLPNLDRVDLDRILDDFRILIERQRETSAEC